MEVTEIDVKVRAVTLYPDPLDPSEEIEWVMGDDLRLTVNPAITFAELAAKVREIKGIPLARMEYSLPPSRKIPKNKWDKNLRAVGIYNNGTVKLQPTTPFCWEWEAIEYYWEKVVEEVLALIDPKEGTTLKVVEEKVKLPHPMKKLGMGAFLRKYPDKIQLEVNTSGSRGDILCKLNGIGNGDEKDYNLPIWT